MNLQSHLGALELNGAIIQNDAMLEIAAGHVAIGPTPQTPWTCNHIEDDRLLESWGVAAGPTTMGGCPTLACRHIDDGVLEGTLQAQPNYTKLIDRAGRCYG